MTGNTIFITYALIPTGETYCQSIHCNYIQKLQSSQDNPKVNDINLNFSDETQFKFLSSGGSSGYTANKIIAIVQIVSNSAYSSIDDVEADSSGWKYLDITSQVVGYEGVLTSTNLTTQVFKVSLFDYDNFLDYDLSYLNYPSKLDDSNLSFGDSTYFFGNVSASIKADIYTTDINISLPLNEFNSTTNKTWDGTETVYISEIGIYDSDKNLIAIGKLNDPVAKDSTIGRTILFALDF